MKDPFEGHRYEIHVVGPPEDAEGHERQYQHCLRCRGCLKIVTERDPVIEAGALWPFILGPRYNGYVPPSAHVLEYGQLCQRKTEEEAMSGQGEYVIVSSEYVGEKVPRYSLMPEEEARILAQVKASYKIPHIPEGQRVLDLPMGKNGAEALTIRDYLVALADLVWKGGEDVVKRPFGNSGWQDEVYRALAEGGLIDRDKYESGTSEEIEIERGKADDLILLALNVLSQK